MTQDSSPALLLFPNLLDTDCDHRAVLPASVDAAVATIDGLIAESEKAGRRFLSRFQTKKPVQDIPIALLNEHTPREDMDFLLEPILEENQRWGLVSDAGLPCIADPGADLVSRARFCNIDIEAFTGPSSILLALMLSGLGGQNFCFHGYLSKEPSKREQQLLVLEQSSRQHKSTQIFIETPYRNQHTLESLVKTLDPHTRLCVAWDLTSPTQRVVSQSITAWRQHELPDIHKQPATFLVRASARAMKSENRAKRAPPRGNHKQKPRRG